MQRWPYILTISLLAFLLAHPAPAKVIFVAQDAIGDGSGSSWGSACTMITAGLAASASGDEIWVKSATYPEAIEMKEGVALYGGFVGTETERSQRQWTANPTVINATGLNSPAVTGADFATLDDFIVTGSTAGGLRCIRTSPMVANCTVSGNSTEGYGGGVYCYGSSPTLSACTITDNTSTRLGGGVCCLDASAPMLIQCTISMNTAAGDFGSGGGIYCQGSSLALVDCTVSANMATRQGGGLYCKEASVALKDCVLSGNAAESAGGAVACHKSSLTLDNCSLVENTAPNGGGMFCFQSSLTLEDCLLSGNIAGGGGGLQCSYSSLALEDCVLSGNRADHAAGGISGFDLSLSLRNCVIEGNVALGGGGGGVSVGDSNLTIVQCDIRRNSSTDIGGGLNIHENSGEIKDCNISNNTSSAEGGGIALTSKSSLGISGCIISGNRAERGAALYCAERSRPILTNCLIVGNRGQTSGAIVICMEHAGPQFHHCTIASNIGDGLLALSESYASFKNSILWNQNNRIPEVGRSVTVSYCCVRGGCEGIGNIGRHPQFVDIDRHDYRLRNGSPCLDSGDITDAPATDIEGNARGAGDGRVDMGAYEAPAHYEADLWPPPPRRLFVDAEALPGGDGRTWQTAFLRINSALLLAEGTAEVWVADGRYGEVIQLVPGLSLYGGFDGGETRLEDRDWVANPTIVDATGRGFTAVWAADDTLLDGFVITGGASVYRGGGIRCDRASPTVANCIIEGNSALDTAGGGGVFIRAASPEFIDCIFRRNTAAGGGGAVYHDYYGLATFSKCRFLDNSAQWGGAFASVGSSEAQLVNCLFARNSAGRGSAVYLSTSQSSRFVNCTLAANTALEPAGGAAYLYRWGSSDNPLRPAQFRNCILWNPGLQIAIRGSYSIDVSHCCSPQILPSKSIIYRDPEFENPEEGDFRLRNGSPCIDRGLVAEAPSMDLEGRPRPGGDGKVDIGAYESPDEYEPGPPPPPPVLYVARDASGSGDGSSWQQAYTTITAALASSATGHEIWVKSARYNESIQLKQGVTVLGGFLGWETSREQRHWTLNETIIDATGLGRSVITGIDEAVLDGFTITGGSSSNGGGIYCYRSSPTFLNCTIRDNTASHEGGGVYCWESSPNLVNCTIRDNTASHEGGGVYCRNSSPTLTNCIIAKNDALEYGGGLCCNSALSPRLVNCTIVDNRATMAGGVFSSQSSPTLTNCILCNRGDEIAGDSINSVTVTYSCVDSGWPGEGNIDGDPRFVDRQGGDFHLQEGSSCIGRGSLVGAPAGDIENSPRPGTDGKVDMGAYECPGECQPGPALNVPRVIFVRSEAPARGDGSSWESAYSSIAAAMEVAGTSDEVWVASGRYRESVHLEPRVAVYGGFLGTEISRGQRDPFVNRTIIDATGLNTHAVVGADLATLDGFTITGGEAVTGGGLYCSYASSTLAQCIVTGNTAGWGAGVYFGEHSSGTVAECRITNNAASWYAGGVYCRHAITLSNCVITDNSARSGAGVYCYSSSTFAGCSITKNAASEVGGGMYCHGGFPRLVNCEIAANTAQSDGGAFYCNQGASPTLTNCKIAANTTKGNGGALNCSMKACPALINCTIVGNRAAQHGAGIYCHDATPTLVNSILWNPGFEVAGEASDLVRASYCCVQGGWPGPGNIDGKPLFVDSRGGDFHLRSGSSCIGSASAEAAPAEDLEGRPRPGGDGRVDIGAYESPDGYEPGPAMNVPEVLRVRAEAPSGGDGSSWESAFSSIRAALEVATTSDEIWVARGTYAEPVQLEPRVSVYGGFGGWEGSREARIDGESISIIDATGLNTHAVVGVDLAVLEGFTITGGDAEYGGGLYCNSTSPTLIRCMITENSAGEGGGVYCISASPTLMQCRISGNSADDGGGLYCSVDSRPTLTNCTVTKNRATDHGRAIYCSHSCPTLTNCTIADNSSDAGISAIYSVLYSRDPLPVLLNCIVWNPGDQIKSFYKEALPQLSHCCVHGGWPGEGNISALPMFVNAAENNYRLQNGSPCIDRGLVAEAPPTDLEGRPRPGSDGKVDMGAYESPDEYEPAPPAHVPVVYVAWDATGRRDGTRWQDAFTTIAEGLAASASGDEVWVKSGTYAEAITLKADVVLFGGFSGSETIQDPRDWAAYPTVINATGLGKSAVIGANNSILDGFVITGGSARYGGGVSASRITQTLRNCTIRGNLGEWGGGGVYFSRVRLTMARCIIANNFTGLHGGGLYCDNTPGTIVDCTISANRSERDGGGLYISAIGNAYSQCDASDGRIPADCTRSCPTFTNCLITDNQAPRKGGGVYCSQVTPTFKNCTIAGNADSGVYLFLHFYFKDWVGGDYWDDFLECGCEAAPALVNCIIWNVNSLKTEREDDDLCGDTVITDAGQEGADVVYSCVQGGWYGLALDIDPQFVDPAAGNYRLQPSSPCIDTGTNDPVLDINVDLDGNTRIWNGQVDMGAYEFDSTPPSPTLTPTRTPVPLPTVTPTNTPISQPTVWPTPVAPDSPHLWLLDGLGQVRLLPALTPTPTP